MSIGDFISQLLAMVWNDTSALVIAPLGLSVRDIMIGLVAISFAAYIFGHMFNKNDAEGGEGERHKSGKGKRYKKKADG